ncbi:DNA primase [Aliidiomarina sp. B3213]|nr:DNA primase [Aliidiomarina sp. B3213]RTE85598.1 DNA primase [Aliidiomarina sp. B3213]TCZ89638.1 DNA primase [Lysobacter sp. N42]
MAGLIPRDFIQDLIARADVVSVIDSRLRLKKAGKNYQACCPFHGEKTPSFTVAPDKQFYHCFGCGAHGNALDFIMEYEGLEFPDAVEALAADMGLEVPREKGTGPTRDKSEIEDDFALMEQAGQFFASQLRKHPNSEKVIDYLKGRGLTGEIVKAFGIGYAPDGWDGILKHLGAGGKKEKQLLALKLISENDRGKRFDFFRDRIMFPIRDKRGRTVGFGGRVLDNDQGPKYLNSPETRLFHKGRELYGFYEMKQKIKQLDTVLIVEGYMDVVALSQHGVHYSVAALGTAATSDHLQLLFRQAPKVVCCFDGDRAGRDAAWRALENALPLMRDGQDLRFLFLPDGEDPDSLIRREGKEQFEAKLNDARSFKDYFFDHLCEGVDLTQDAGKAKLIADAKPLIEKVHSDFYGDLLKEELAKRLGRSVAQVDHITPKTNSTFKAQEKRQKYTPVERAIGLLLQNPWLGKSVKPNKTLEKLKMDHVKVLLALHRQTQSDGLTPATVLEGWRGTKHEEKLRELALWDHAVSEQNIEREFQETFLFLVDRYFEQRYEELRLLPKEELTPEKQQELVFILKSLKGMS